MSMKTLVGNNWFGSNKRLEDTLSPNEKEKLANNTVSNIQYNPKTGKHHASVTPELHDVYEFNGPVVMDQELFEQGQGVIRGAAFINASKTVIDKAMYSPFPDEYLPYAVQVYDEFEQIRQGRLRGAAITGGHPNYADIRNVVLSGEVIEWINRDAILMQTGDVKKTQYLKVDVDDIINSFEATPDLQDLDVSEEVNIEYDRISLKLKKYQARATYSRWINNYVFDHDPIQDIMARLDLDIPLKINSEIAATIATIGGTAASGTYDTVVAANFHYTTNPTVDFVADKTTIYQNGGKRNRMVMNDKTKTFTFQNSYLRAGGVLSAIDPIEQTGSMAVTHPLIKDASIYVDEALGNGVIAEFDNRGLLIGDGPQSVRSYTKELEYTAGRVVDKWQASKVRRSSVFVRRTGAIS